MPRLSSVLNLSTSHLTEKVAQSWNDPDSAGDGDWKNKFVNSSTYYGFMIYTPVMPGADEPDRASMLPPCIQDAVNLARRYGAEFIIYDQDEEANDELPIYDW